MDVCMIGNIHIDLPSVMQSNLGGCRWILGTTFAAGFSREAGNCWTYVFSKLCLFYRKLTLTSTMERLLVSRVIKSHVEMVAP
jgi:hypothetical protein